MAKTMKITAAAAVLLTLLCGLWSGCAGGDVPFALTITFGTTAYHFGMRLLVGQLFDMLLNNRVNYRARWFRVSAAEQALYQKLRVKRWKGKMATYDPDCFDRRRHSWDEIAQAMCQAELVHEVIILFSFVPLFASVFVGALPVFVITSVLAAGFDAMFVIMQRFNRPRVIQLIDRSGR